MVQDIAEKESIKVLEKATVPIVKMTDKYSDVKVSRTCSLPHCLFVVSGSTVDTMRVPAGSVQATIPYHIRTNRL